jgi:hypothetical protein
LIDNCRAKGLWWDSQLEEQIRHLLDKYRKCGLSCRYRRNGNDEQKPDHELHLTYGNDTIDVYAEGKNWEPYTKSGRPSCLTGLNYAEKVGRKFEGYDGQRFLLVKNPLHKTAKAEAYLEKDRITEARWDQFKHWLKEVIRNLLGLKSSMYRTLCHIPSNIIETLQSNFGTLRGYLRANKGICREYTDSIPTTVTVPIRTYMNGGSNFDGSRPLYPSEIGALTSSLIDSKSNRYLTEEEIMRTISSLTSSGYFISPI